MGLRRRTPVRVGFAAIAAVLAVLVGSPATAQTSVKVALDGSFMGPSAPFFVAQDRGYYRSAKLDVSIEAISAPPDAISRVASGAAEFTVVDINTFLKYREQNPDAPVKAVFMIYNEPPYAIIARKSRGITKPKDLEGKRLGAPAAEPASAQWPYFAKLNDIDVAKVKVENVAAAVREPMLAAGQVDAVTGNALSTYISLKDRGVPVDDLLILQMTDYGLQLYGDAIIVNTNFASERREVVKAFIAAYIKGLKATISDPARAIASLTKRNEAADKDVELERLRMAIENNIVTDEVLENGLGGVDTARLANAIAQLGQISNFKTVPAPSEVFDPSFLPPAAQRRVGGRPRPG